MTLNEEKLIQLLREHNDPRAWDLVIDIMQRLISGESMDSIAASYGIDLDENGYPV